MEQSPAEAGNCSPGQEFLSFCRTWACHCKEEDTSDGWHCENILM